MVSFKFTALAVAAFSAVNVIAAQDTETVKVEQVVPQGNPDIGDVKWEDMAKFAETGEKQWEDKKNELPLSVDVKVTFPDAEIFGVKLVNGRPTRALLHITNNEEEPVKALVAVGALWSPSNTPGAPDPPVAVRNLTGANFDTLVQPKSTETLTYTFATIMHPQDLTLDIKTLISRGPRVFTVTAFSESVSVVEAPVSIFDPQIIFLYTFLLAAFGGVCYFIYNTWISTLFPQKKRGGKGGERAKRSSGGSKPVDPSEQVAVRDADGPAVTTGSKGYDESWIPTTHLSRPQAKRVGSGRPKSRAA